MKPDHKTTDKNWRECNRYTPWEERLWTGIAIGEPNECWPWKRSGIMSGYGLIFINKKRFLTHRIAYEVSKGPIPDGQCVCHSCDNPRCCNPNHLFAGTFKQNWDDMRQKHRNPRGNTFPQAKLTPEKVRYARRQKKLGFNCKEIAAAMGVDRMTISNAVRRVSWQHVV